MLRGGSEPFQPNPRGLKGYFQLKATIPKGSKVVVGGSGYNWYSNGEEELGGDGQPGSTPAVIRIAEILSLQSDTHPRNFSNPRASRAHRASLHPERPDRVEECFAPPAACARALLLRSVVSSHCMHSHTGLFYEGEKLSNCLRGARGSQAKYLSRARARVSSFWSLTKQEPGEEVKHLCLIEVWHMGRGRNEIRQAEGPHPRTIPDAEAWYWMDRCALRPPDGSNAG